MGTTALVTTIVFSSIFALGYKAATRYNCELRAVNLWLNVSALLAVFIYYVFSGPNFSGTAMLLGLASGACGYAATLSFFYHMRSGYLSVSWAVIGTAVAFPVAASVLIWQEHLTARQWCGVALIPVALFLFAVGRRNTEK